MSELELSLKSERAEKIVIEFKSAAMASGVPILRSCTIKKMAAQDACDDVELPSDGGAK